MESTALHFGDKVRWFSSRFEIWGNAKSLKQDNIFVVFTKLAFSSACSFLKAILASLID